MFRVTNAAAGMAAGATAGRGSGVEWRLCAETGHSRMSVANVELSQTGTRNPATPLNHRSATECADGQFASQHETGSGPRTSLVIRFPPTILSATKEHEPSQRSFIAAAGSIRDTHLAESR
jgi:hypothetical protein